MPATPVTWLEEFNVTLSVSPQDPDIIQLANGNILVSWSSTDPARPGASGDEDIIGQIFDPLGNPVGSAFRINQGFFADDENNADLAALPGGGFMMVFQDVETTGVPLRVNVYDAAGNVTFSSTIETDGATTVPNFRNPHVAVSSATSALVVYEQTTASGTTIVGRIYDPSTGTVGSQVNLIAFAEGNFDPDVTVLSNGNYVITATRNVAGDSEIIYRIVNSAGTNVLGVTAVAETEGDGFTDNEASVTALAGGGFVISYTDTDANDTDVAYVVYNSAGTLVGSGTAGNTSGNTTNNSNESAVVGLSDGSFVIVFDNDEDDVLEATHVSATGSFLGSFTFSGAGTELSAIDLGDGRFAVTWESFTDGGGVKMEILDTRDFVNPTPVYTPEPNWQVGTIFADVFTTDGDADIVHGHTGDDTITDGGLTEDNQYFGDAGDDTIFAVSSIGGDLWDGGADNDTIDWSQNFSLGNGTIFDLGLGTVTDGFGLSTEVMVNFENWNGTNQDDTVKGTAGINMLSGNGGNDTLNGDVGADVLFGGLGNDTYIVDNSGEVVTEAAGEGTDTVRTAVSYTLTANVEKLVLTGAAAVNGTGNNLNNIMAGNGAANILDGKAGSDDMAGLGGNDTYIVDNVGDQISEQVGNGTDTARSSVNYGLSANVEKLVLTGAAEINGTGSADDNAIAGNGARNVIDGRGGSDDLFGGAGTDVFVFSTALSASNIDTIMDFSAVDDTIRLVKSVFTGFAIGPLPSASFKDLAVSAIDANDRILYNHNTGVLSYDTDGSGAAVAVQFAILDNNAILSASDFQIV